MGLFDKVRNRRDDSDDEVELRDLQANPRGDPGRTIAKRRRDRLRNEVNGDSDEVELSDPDGRSNARSGRDRDRERSRDRTTDGRTSSGSRRDTSSDSQGDKFLLPGMAPENDDNDTGRSGTAGRSSSPSRTSSGNVSGSVEDKMDEVLEQNERIIALLEEIADRTPDDGQNDSIW